MIKKKKKTETKSTNEIEIWIISHKRKFLNKKTDNQSMNTFKQKSTKKKSKSKSSLINESFEFFFFDNQYMEQLTKSRHKIKIIFHKLKLFLKKFDHYEF